MFAQFLKMHTDLPYIDPSIFMKEGWIGNKEYSVLWKDYSLWHYGKIAQAMKKELVTHARPLAPTLSPGLTYMHPACALDPYAQMKYQILESMMAPNFSGYLMYAGNDIDLGDMKYMGQANTLMRRFEEIILKGKSIKPIEINEWSGIRIKKLGSKGLVLVSDYSTYEPEEKVVRFSSKELFEKTLIDAETEEKVEPVLGVYNVKIKSERAPLFHFTTQ